MPQNHQAGSKASTANPLDDPLAYLLSDICDQSEWPGDTCVTRWETACFTGSLVSDLLAIQIFPQVLHQSKLQQSSSLQCPSAALGWLDYGVGEVLPFSEVVGPAKGTTMASCPGINSLNFSFFFHCDWRDRDFAVILRYYQGASFKLGLSSSDSLQNSHPLPWVFGVLVDGSWNNICWPKCWRDPTKLKFEYWGYSLWHQTQTSWTICKGKSLKIQPIDFSIISSPPPIMSKWMIPVYPGAPHLCRISSEVRISSGQIHTEDPWRDDSVLLILLVIPKMVSQGDCWALPGVIVTTRSN